MFRILALAFVAVLLIAVQVQAGVSGTYVEARTCDVWTGPCFANAEINLTGKHAVMAWHVEKGNDDQVRLDGLGVVAVIRASDTLGARQTGPAQVLFIVDKNANPEQRQALIRMAQKQGGKLLQNVIAVRSAEVKVEMVCPCKNNVCATVQAGPATIKTRCLHEDHDRACGKESAYFPPLAHGVSARPAAATEHSFTGRGMGHTWRDYDRRGAYVGTFSVR